MYVSPDVSLTDVMGLLLDAICVVDPQGRFISITGAGEHIFGYKPEEMIGKPMIDFVYHEDRARTLQAVDKIMDGHCQRYFENRYLKKNGEVAHIMWSARWSEDGQVRVAVARDVSDRIHVDLENSNKPNDIQPSKTPPCWRLSASPPRLIPPGFSPISLSSQDYIVMLTLARGGKGVSREDVVQALGGNYLEYDQRRLDTQMRRLRRKVEEACGLQLPVTTLRGVGYHFYDEIEVFR